MDQDDGILSKQLDSLRLPDGKPDLKLRTANLLSLASSLRTSEHRLLRAYFQEHRLQKDILPDLPIDILITILDLLNIDDILRLFGVSKTWSGILNGKIVLNFLVNKFYPDILHHPRVYGAEGSFNLEFLQSSFREAALKYLTRVNGVYQSVSASHYRWENEVHFQLDRDFHDYADETLEDYYSRHCGGRGTNETSVSNPIYSHGRIAWRATRQAIVLDNLLTEKRRLFLDGDMRIAGSDVKLLALGEKLLVASVNRSLLIWEIDTTAMTKLSLTGPIKRCCTEGYRVAFTTYSHQAFFWQRGGRLQSLNLSPAMRAPELVGPEGGRVTGSLFHWHTCTDILLHPHDEQTLFVVNAFPSGNRITWEVHAYKDLRYCRTTGISCPADGVPWPQMVNFVVKVQKVNSHGWYGLGFTMMEDYQSPLPLMVSPRSTVHYLVTFNVWRSELESRRFHPGHAGSRAAQVLNEMHPWNDRLFFHFSTGIAEVRALLMCSGPTAGRRFTVYGTTDLLYKNFSKRDYHARDRRPVWETVQTSARSLQIHELLEAEYAFHAGDTPFCFKIEGDDDFMVLFAEDGYIVWDFQGHNTDRGSMATVVFGRGPPRPHPSAQFRAHVRLPISSRRLSNTSAGSSDNWDNELQTEDEQASSHSSSSIGEFVD